jgi:hypothetical protein
LIDTQRSRPFNLIDITKAMVEDDSESLLEASDIDEYGEVKELFEELSKLSFPLAPTGVKEVEVCGRGRNREVFFVLFLFYCCKTQTFSSSNWTHV